MKVTITSGPWRVETERTQSGRLCVIKIVSNAIERGCIAFEDKDTTEQTLANFKHIVACVNALEGGQPTVVKSTTVQPTVKNSLTVQYVNALKGYNPLAIPDLIEAATWGLDALLGIKDTAAEHQCAIRGLRAALAKLKENA